MTYLYAAENANIWRGQASVTRYSLDFFFSFGRILGEPKCDAWSDTILRKTCMSLVSRRWPSGSRMARARVTASIVLTHPPKGSLRMIRSDSPMPWPSAWMSNGRHTCVTKWARNGKLAFTISCACSQVPSSTTSVVIRSSEPSLICSAGASLCSFWSRKAFMRKMKLDKKTPWWLTRWLLSKFHFSSFLNRLFWVIYLLTMWF